MPRYQLRNTVTNERLDIEGTLPIDVSALVKNGTYKIRAMSEEAAGEIVVDADATISALSPADGAIQVPIDANLVMTFTGAMKRQGTVDLRAVGGALIESFDLATEGTWSSGDTVWTGNPAANFSFGAELCVRWSGLEDFKGNELANNTGDTLWNFRSESLGLSLVDQEVSPNVFTTNKDFTITGTAGDRMVFVVATGTVTNSVDTIMIDPGGANQTAVTIRTQGHSNNARIVIADAIWPVSGSLTVRVTFTGVNAAGQTALTVLNARSLNFINASNATFASVSPAKVVQTINTTVGQSVLFAAMLNSQVDFELIQGVNEEVGVIQSIGTRGHYLAKNNGVAGGSPQTFEMVWPTASFVPGHAALGVYG